MRLLGAIILVAAQLGGAFGEASAEVDELSDRSMIVDLEVEVVTSADAVVAHLSFDDDPTVAMPLLDRGDGVYGARTELEPKNYAVVFEAVGPAGEMSEPVSLVELGADLGEPFARTGSTSAGAREEGLSPETQRMGWLALALGASSLSVLAFWVLGGREKHRRESAAEESRAEDGLDE